MHMWMALVALALAQAPAPGVAFKRLADGKEWTTRNLDVDVQPSTCYDGKADHCRTYGRLYEWAAAGPACAALGTRWRLPTNEEWRALGVAYGGLREETADKGRAAYEALIVGGRSGFDVVFGGGRNDTDRQYARLDAHGFYWTATESGPDTAWLYNFGRSGQSMNRHSDGEKRRAFAVRCVRDSAPVRPK
jgi:uncharacterized protein (TIGR02145 family)